MIEIIIFIISFIETVDVSGGLFSFILTPFHVTSLLYFCILFVKSYQYHFKINKGKLIYFFQENFYLIPIVILMCMSSVLVNYDPLGQSARKTLVIFWNILFAISFVYKNLKSLKPIFLSSIKPIIIIQAIFMAKQYLVSLRIISFPTWLDKFLPESSLEEIDIGAFKAGGIFFDANRAAIMIIILMIIYYILKLEKSKISKNDLFVIGLGTLEVILSLSRMGIGIIIFAILYLVAKKILNSVKKISSKKSVYYLFFVILFLSSLVLLIAFLANDSAIISYLDHALLSSPQRKASTEVHFLLIFDGLEVMLSTLKNFLFGVGWGTEYIYAGKYFVEENLAFANFHSGFIGMGVQSGVISLAFMLIYMFKPILMKYKFALVMGLLIPANIFYSYFIQPSYWIILIVSNIKYIELLSKEIKFTARGKLMDSITL
jgi:hypothetical protein